MVSESVRERDTDISRGNERNLVWVQRVGECV